MLRVYALLILLLSVVASAQPTLFDATWDVPANTPRKPTTMPVGIKPIIWAPYATHSHGTEQTTDAQIRRFAGAVRDGHPSWACWTGPIRIPSGSLVCLDFEVELTHGMLDPAGVAKMFAAYHDESPGLRVTTYLGFPGMGSRDDFRAGASRLPAPVKAAISKEKKKWKQVIDQLDVVCLDSYLLSADQVDRDLKVVRNQAAIFRSYYPGKPVYAWITGYYTWFGKEEKIDAATLARYIDAIYAAKYEGVVVWGAYDQCDLLIDDLLKRGALKVQP